MKWWRITASSFLAIGIVILAGCDGGSLNQDGPGGVGGRPTVSGPRLDRITPRDFCVGEEVLLEGINFSPTLENNRATFDGVPGLPTRVEFPSDGDSTNGLESRLRVLVPTGVVSGNLDLRVSGVSGGVRDYTACPQLISYAIGNQGLDPTLVHSGVLGFNANNPPITAYLFGLNFEGISQIVVQDRTGQQAEIPRAQFLNPVITFPPNRLQVRQFTLASRTLAVTLTGRDNLVVMVDTDDVRSNQLTIPVRNVNENQATPPKGLGPVINGILLPPGVRTGPVRIRYCLYTHPTIDQAFATDVRWSIDNGRTLNPAAPDLTDPEHSGTRQILPGDIEFGPPAGILFAGGSLRTFTWNPADDVEFQRLQNQGSAPRNRTIRFYIRCLPEPPTNSNNPPDQGILVESPPLAYFHLPDLGTATSIAERSGKFVETFQTNAFQDRSINPGETPVRWGPPLNPNELSGVIPFNVPSKVGSGDFDLVLAPVSPPPPFGQFIVINTDDMRILHVLVLDQAGTNLDILQIFPTLDEPNPGQDAGEFHLGTLEIRPGLDVFLFGSRPAVFRISGPDKEDFQVTFRMDGVMNASGEAGDAGPASAPNVTTVGLGGLGLCGGGRGGNGAGLQLDFAGGVTNFLRSEAGENDGGEGGETAAAVDPTAPSKFLGAPGGGGGHRIRGSNADSGLPRNPSNFTVPRAGRGGPMRGSANLLQPTAGSGGGGGGATVIRQAGGVAAATPSHGGGGGGGGGALHVVAHGSMVIGGRILANGGRGGDGASGTGGSGAGGGGSGGSILLQATGFISVGCGNLETNAGDNGASSGQNQRPGSGEGSPGWIRVEPRFGGGPFCGVLAVESDLTARVNAGVAPTTVINVRDSSRFPPKGTVLIDQELIGYGRMGPNVLQDLTRGLNGTANVAHEIGAKVILDAPVTPTSGLVRETSDIQRSPDVIFTGLGGDGSLHVFFIPTIDPDTGEQQVDPVTGNAISVWQIDTDTGTVVSPEGVAVLTSASARTDPGLFLLSRLRIDANVILRGTGLRPLRIQVTEEAEIGGTLDISGFDGGLIEFDVNNLPAPSPGAGGSPGPGGGPGGTGGTASFLDGNIANKDPSNVIIIAARNGGLPLQFPAEFDKTGLTSGSVPPPTNLAPMETTRATGGEGLRDPNNCGGTPANPCSAGGGGGGGAREPGLAGKSRPAGSTAFGQGGSRIGLDTIRFGGDYLLVGGQGGAGGGGSAVVSNEYQNGNAGPAIFQGRARVAPGTGGGGGGGSLHLTVFGVLHLRGTGRIFARGGNAFQSIDLAGNGGAGGGGMVFIQLVNSLVIEPGAKIDVRGGKANLRVPISPGAIQPLYEGNIRQVPPAPDPREFGGGGGEGAVGRVRIEAPEGSNLLTSSFNDSIFSSVFLPDSHLSVGRSLSAPLGVGSGKRATSHALILDGAVIRFAEGGLPDGTRAVVLWRGSSPSLDVQGATTPLRGGVENPKDLENVENLQFTVQFLSNPISGETPTIDEVQVPFKLSSD